jgi:hypothetical protein
MFTIPDWLRDEIQERWERLALRAWINKNPRIIVSITIASVLILLVIIGLSMPQRAVTTTVKEYKKAWFYDPNTGRLFVVENDAVFTDTALGTLADEKQAPIKAYVFSYADEPNETNRFIGFLEKPNPSVKKEVFETSGSVAGGAKQWGQGRLIRRVDDEQWVLADSNEGQTILKELFLPNKNGEVAHYCPPE